MEDKKTRTLVQHKGAAPISVNLRIGIPPSASRWFCKSGDDRVPLAKNGGQRVERGDGQAHLAQHELSFSPAAAA